MEPRASMTMFTLPGVHTLLGQASKLLRRRLPMTHDVTFVVPPSGTDGWILGAICREVAERLDDISSELVNADAPLPRSQVYFFSHYMYFLRALRGLSSARLGRNYVFATHLEPGKHGIADADIGRLLSLADGVVCMNGALRERLTTLGVPRSRLHVVVGAADRSAFVPHRRNLEGYVGFCSAFYPRKRPDVMLQIVRSMPHRQFVLLGRGWQTWSAFGDLASLPNFTYVEPNYQDYAGWYSKMTVFVSVSNLEGGPIPLVESMFSNVVPVVSDTGFARDLIQHGNNGFIFDIEAPFTEICSLIDKAFAVERDVSGIVDECDWVTYAGKLKEIMQLQPQRAAKRRPVVTP